MLNEQTCLCRFEHRGGSTVFYNRAHLVTLALEPGVNEAECDAGYEVATHRYVGMLLSTSVELMEVGD